jgi:DNA polymerase-4
MNKPDGLTLIRPEEVDAVIESLVIQKVPGVGRKTFQQLEAMGVKTLGDIKKFPESMLLNRLGKFGSHLLALSSGRDHSAVTPFAPPKSVSSERTLSEDTQDIERLKTCLLQQAEEVARQLRKANVKAGTITLKLKHADFKQVTRSKTVAAPTQSSKTIYRCAVQLLDDYRLAQKVRLIGVGTTGFKSAEMPVQQDLFEKERQSDADWSRVDRTLESITQKFGSGAIKRASLSDE